MIIFQKKFNIFGAALFCLGLQAGSPPTISPSISPNSSPTPSVLPSMQTTSLLEEPRPSMSDSADKEFFAVPITPWPSSNPQQSDSEQKSNREPLSDITNLRGASILKSRSNTEKPIFSMDWQPAMRNALPASAQTSRSATELSPSLDILGLHKPSIPKAHAQSNDMDIYTRLPASVDQQAPLAQSRNKLQEMLKKRCDELIESDLLEAASCTLYDRYYDWLVSVYMQEAHRNQERLKQQEAADRLTLSQRQFNITRDSQQNIARIAQIHKKDKEDAARAAAQGVPTSAAATTPKVLINVRGINGACYSITQK